MSKPEEAADDLVAAINGASDRTVQVALATSAILAAKAEERQGALNEIDTLIESLNEGLMTDAGLTQADRDGMTHQVMALHVAADTIRKRGEG